MGWGRGEFDVDDDWDTPSVRVVVTVAAYANLHPDDLPPLGDALDPDALDRLVASMRSGAITFEYAGYDVRLAADGDVSLTPLESGQHA